MWNGFGDGREDGNEFLRITVLLTFLAWYGSSRGLTEMWRYVQYITEVVPVEAAINESIPFGLFIPQSQDQPLPPELHPRKWLSPELLHPECGACAEASWNSGFSPQTEDKNHDLLHKIDTFTKSPPFATIPTHSCSDVGMTGGWCTGVGIREGRGSSLVRFSRAAIGQTRSFSGPSSNRKKPSQPTLFPPLFIVSCKRLAIFTQHHVDQSTQK